MKLNKEDILLFSGDSITDGNRGKKMDLNHIFGHGYQYTVASALALKYSSVQPKFINKGYSGYTVSKLLETWQEDVIDNNPTIISVLIGTNDAASGFFGNLTPEQCSDVYEQNLEKMISVTESALAKVKFVICEPFYFPLERNGRYDKTPHPYCEQMFNRPDNCDTDEFVSYMIKALDLIRSKVKDVALRHSFIFVPLYDCFCENIKESSAEYFIWDGTHPTIAGHALIAEQWMKYTDNI